jgi:hypothetical protein
MDIRRGESSVLVGDGQLVPGWDEGRIGRWLPIIGPPLPTSPKLRAGALSDAASKERPLAVVAESGDRWRESWLSLLYEKLIGTAFGAVDGGIGISAISKALDDIIGAVPGGDGMLLS